MTLLRKPFGHVEADLEHDRETRGPFRAIEVFCDVKDVSVNAYCLTYYSAEDFTEERKGRCLETLDIIVSLDEDLDQQYLQTWIRSLVQAGRPLRRVSFQASSLMLTEYKRELADYDEWSEDDKLTFMEAMKELELESDEGPCAA